MHKPDKYAEVRKKISNTMKGKKPNNCGMKRSEETKKKMSEARSGANNHKARAVICVDIGKYFSTITEAKNWVGLKSGVSICYACSGHKKTAGKHPVTGERLRWAYYDEYLKQQEQQGA